MSNSDFFEDYLKEVEDDEVYKNIVTLKHEYTKSIEEVESRARKQAGPALLAEMTTGRKIELNHQEQKMSLENEYKFKAMVTAEPHIKDKAKFKEIAQKHAPDKEYIEKNQLQNHPVIKSIQEEKAEELTAAQIRAKQIEELNKRWAENRDITKEP